jgi:ATP-dependent DNA helicase RecQ
MIIARLLEELLQTGEVPSWAAELKLPQAVSRLVAAVQAGASGLDWAVLLRHCLRHLPDHARVTDPGISREALALLRRVGVGRALDGTLVPDPYCPEWVADLGGMALDLPRRRQTDRDQYVLAEPWLRRFTGSTSWKSAAQRDATWSALNATENSTVLVGLPTGSGKSLVYQCCAAFEAGLTVLIVPTVALGIDQLSALWKLPFANSVNPLLYETGTKAGNVLESVQSRQCRLLIASPEAVVAGRLREVLHRHAEGGFLRRLVIDEAHLIESWGADFRIEFQLLGAVLRNWRAVAPSGIRALLLSATFAPSTPPMLREMFAGDGVVWEQHIVQRLRPEIHYFSAVRWCQAEEQIEYVSEALRYLPRPAILYVTEVSEACVWGERLRNAGFSRFRVFHGDTDKSERKEIMDAWREDSIDLVVATSAFGMGVDKAGVRTVVHACMPEGIDRFYQEVGRGGRDGEPCISLLVPKLRDVRVARSLGPTLLSHPEKVSGRWHAMWHSRCPVMNADGSSSGAFKVRTDVQPAYRFGTESFTENIRWNKRLLLMMDRAGLVHIESLIWERSLEEGVEFAVIRPLHSTLSLASDLADLLEEPRRLELERTRLATDRLIRYFNRRQPVCQELKAHYGRDTLRACGSCGFCRAHGERAAIGTRLLLEEDSVIAFPGVQVVQGPILSSQKARSDVAMALRQLLKTQRPLRVFLARHHRADFDALLELADDCRDQPYRVDDLEPDGVASVAPKEAVIVIHFGAVDERARVLNQSGRWVAHWLLGGNIEHTAGRWPFMHEVAARAYPGGDGLGRWLRDIQCSGVAA